MVTIAEAYKRVNEEWPSEVPALTDWEAVRAASRLWRWARGRVCPIEIRTTSGNRTTWVRGGVLWVNPDKGWKIFIHDLSHYLDLEPENHSKHHAKLERRMIREVIKRGWLDGRLKETDKPAPAPVDARLAELQRIEALAKKWEAKQRRAANALKKLNRRRKYYERTLAATATA